MQTSAYDKPPLELPLAGADLGVDRAPRIDRVARADKAGDFSWLARAGRRVGKSVGNLMVPLAFPALVLLLWWVATARVWLPENILPGPATVVATFGDLLKSGDLAVNLEASLRRVAEGAALGVTLGLGLGLALGFSATVETWVGPLFRMVAQIPSIALIPLLMMVLGIDDALKLFIMAKACIIPIAFTTSDGIRNIPAAYLEVGRVFRLSRWTFVTRIILPGALTSIFSGVRQGLAHVWVSLIAVEVLASADGIGYLMTWGRQIFQLDVVLVCVVVIGVIGFLLDFGLKRLEAVLLRWR